MRHPRLGRIMRPFLLLLAAVVLLPTAAAQIPSFNEDYQVRAALGDIPSTTAIEPAGTWNVEQRITVAFDNNASELDRTYLIRLPVGSTLVNATCDCARSTHTQTGDTLSLRIEPLTESGQRTLTILTRQPVADVYGFRVAPTTPTDLVVILYVPVSLDATSNVPLREVGLSTDRTATLFYQQFGASDYPFDLWFSIHPATTAVAPSDAEANPLPWLFLVLGLAAGALLWSQLVARGIVQKKSRKQVAAPAAHVEAAKESVPVLEGKKRGLLAALKELELAKQANELPLEVYDAVKADFKRQAVTVMRALEDNGDKP